MVLKILLKTQSTSPRRRK